MGHVSKFVSKMLAKILARFGWETEIRREISRGQSGMMFRTRLSKPRLANTRALDRPSGLPQLPTFQI